MAAPGVNVAATRLEDVMLDEKAYEADLRVNERAQVFTTEIARLSLLALAGLAFLLINPKSGELRAMGPAWLLWAILPALGISVGGALLHRYFSTDCIVCQVAILRLIQRLEHTDSSAPERAPLEHQLAERRMRQGRDLFLCRNLTLVAAVALAIGAAGLAVMLASAYAG